MTIADTSETIAFTCPRCGWTGDFDRKFASWCARCEYGLSAMTPEETRQWQEEKGPRHGVDGAPPANYLRARLLTERPHRAPAVTISPEEWEAVDRELSPVVAASGAALLR